MSTDAPGRFDHAALIVDSDDTVERLLVPVLRRHVAARQNVLVIVNPGTEHVLRTRLGPDADGVEWGVADAFYGRLGFAFAGFRHYLRAQHAQGRTVHVIAEPDVATDLEAPVDRVAAYLSYEAMCNDVYAGYGCPVTCIWDSRRHPTLVIEGVRSIHDHELTAEGRRENRTFVPAAEYLSGRAEVAMSPEPDVSDLDFAVTGLGELTGCRVGLWAWAVEFGFADAAADQVTSAANEVITNGLRHGRPPVRVRAWHHDKTLIVQIDDHGGRALPADAGYRPPGGPGDGIGLWLARQLADVLLTRTAAGRTSVRLYFPYAVTHRELDVHA
ncbi:sensor histidine kinase [Cryptosporangium arvum]|uniref:sensor histidine kinase n=1 Tax=Cryptosporangium arvum TaxID=80871 RepID=UPI0004BB3461|nr:sensor histidine kinase [Cryptosporangium arvum]